MDIRNINNPENKALIDEMKNDDGVIPEDVDTKINAEEPDPVEPEDEEPEVEVEESDESEEDDDNEPEVDDEIDYEEKYRNSSREALSLHFKNKKLTDTITEASALPEPTKEELIQYAREQGADFEELDAFSQNVLKKTLINERKFEMIAKTSEANKRIDAWAKDVDDFTGAPETLAKYPALEGEENRFRRFAMKEQRRGMDMEDLVASFLFNTKKDTPISKRKGKKKSMLLKGGKGDGVPKPKKLNADELRIIRIKDPRRYERLVKEGKAGLDILDLD